jgi:CHAT domain-containing protein
MGTGTTLDEEKPRMTRRLLTIICQCAVLAVWTLAPAPAAAQEDEIDGLIEKINSSAATRDAQALVASSPPQTDDKHELAVFYHKRGMAHYTLGHYGQSVGDLQLAFQNNMPNRLTPGEWGDRWRIQDDLGNSLRTKGDWISERSHWESVASLYAADSFQHHLAKRSLSRILTNLGDFAAADQALKEADETLDRMSNLKSWGWLRLNTLYINQSQHALVESAKGNSKNAEHLYRLAMENAQDDFDRQVRSPQYLRIATQNLADARGNLASILATRGKLGEAEFFAQATVESAIKYGGPNSLQTAGVLGRLAHIRHQTGNFAGAENLYRHAVVVALKSGGASGQRERLGNFLVEQKKWTEAIVVFNERADVLQQRSEKRLSADSVSWALALHRSGSSQSAREMTERLLNLQQQRSVPNPYYLACQRGVLAMTLTAQGDLSAALAAFQLALPELLRSNIEHVSVSRVFWRTEILEAYLDLLARLQVARKVPPGLDVVAESFRIADLARGSSVQAAIAASAARAQLPNAELAQLVRRDQDTQNQAVALDKILSRLATVPEEQRLNKVIADMRVNVERLRKEHTELQADIQHRFPEYGELLNPKPATLPAVTKALAPGEALVSIYLGETQSYVWTVGNQGKSNFRIVPLGRSEIGDDVARLRAGMAFNDDEEQLPAFDLPRASKLYQAFLAPDAALWQDAKVLSIIPHGELGQIPFSLLPTTAIPLARENQVIDTTTPWLIRKVAIAQLPSANAFLALRRSQVSRTERGSFIGFGDPIFVANAGVATKRGRARNLVIGKEVDTVVEQLSKSKADSAPVAAKAPATASLRLANAFQHLPALPDTGEELLEIATALKAEASRDVYVGRRATETQVKQTNLDNRRVVAFATHGIASGELTGMDQPALVLSNPALTGETDADGFLTMDEVLGLKLDADWVVLSACNTASSDGKASEAVSGLGRAFFFAGARSLLVTNWAVETTSARLLTTSLFRREVENPALTRAEALRQAMLDVMNSGDEKIGLSYAHPAFWAPFSLIGDGIGRH